MILQAFPSGPLETNAYLIACPQTREACIIDPAPNSAHSLISFIQKEQLTPVAIWLTHSHWDHIADVSALKSKFSIPVFIHPLDAPNLEHLGADGLPSWMPVESVKPDKLLQEGDIVTIGKVHFNVIHTPGHSPGGVCFYCPDENVLISGDTLFKGSIGNISFPTSDPDSMWTSLEKLAKLPVGTQVFPGHGPSTTIGQERWLSRAKDTFG